MKDQTIQFQTTDGQVHEASYTTVMHRSHGVSIRSRVIRTRCGVAATGVTTTYAVDCKVCTSKRLMAVYA